MRLLTLIFAPLTATVVGLILLLNALGAGVGVSVAVLGLTAGTSGAVIGYFSDRLPSLPRPHGALHRTQRH